MPERLRQAPTERELIRPGVKCVGIRIKRITPGILFQWCTEHKT